MPTVVSKNDIGLRITRLIASFWGVRPKEDSDRENLRDEASWKLSI
jgi:hypothetical protein